MADNKTKAAATKAEQTARTQRARTIAQRMKADAATTSGILADVWNYLNHDEKAPALHKADALAIREDFLSVTGEKKMPATRREFIQAWLPMIKKYATAQDDKTGAAVTVHPYAGMVEAVDFVPTWSSVWTDIVCNWVRSLAPMKMKRGVWYEKKNRSLSALSKAESNARKEAYEERRKIALEGAKAGREDALRKYDGEKAAAEA